MSHGSTRPGLSVELGHIATIASTGRVVSLFRNYTPHATARVEAVAFSARYQVNVTVHYRLSGDFATVDPHVETENGRILPEQECAYLYEKLLAGTHFRRPKVKIIGCMPLWDNEYVQFSYRVLVLITTAKLFCSKTSRSPLEQNGQPACTFS